MTDRKDRQLAELRLKLESVGLLAKNLNDIHLQELLDLVVDLERTLAQALVKS